MAEKKTRWYTVQRNYDFETHDADKNVTRDISPEDWREEVERYMHDLYENGTIKQYAMIFHDKDKLETGFKPIHVHMIVELKNPSTKGNATKKLKASSDRNIDYVDDKGARAGASRYLLHVTEKAMQEDKHIYGEDELITEGGLDVRKMMKDTAKQSKSVTYNEIDRIALALTLEIERNGMTLEQANQALFDQIEDPLVAQNASLNWEKRFETSDARYKKSRAQQLRKNKRDLTTIFVTGKGGTGKSSFALMLALAIKDEAPYKVAVGGKGKTFDFADGYDREAVTILDDAKSAQFDMEEYLQVFDPYIYSPVSSRNTNKPWLSDYAFLTTSESINDFNEDLMIYSAGGSKFKSVIASPFGENESEVTGQMAGHPALNDNPKTIDRFYQVSRRVKYVFEIVNKTITMRKFNHKTVEYEKVATYPWDVLGDPAVLDATIAQIYAKI